MKFFKKRFIKTISILSLSVILATPVMANTITRDASWPDYSPIDSAVTITVPSLVEEKEMAFGHSMYDPKHPNAAEDLLKGKVIIIKESNDDVLFKVAIDAKKYPDITEMQVRGDMLDYHKETNIYSYVSEDLWDTKSLVMNGEQKEAVFSVKDSYMEFKEEDQMISFNLIFYDKKGIGQFNISNVDILLLGKSSTPSTLDNKPTNKEIGLEKIQIERSIEEKQDIVEFISQYRYLNENSFDRNNPDQEKLVDFMRLLLEMERDIIEYEVVGPESKYYLIGENTILDRRYTEESVNKKCMELFGSDIDFEKYPIWDNSEMIEKGYIYMLDPQDIIPAPRMEIKDIYSLGGNRIYINFERLSEYVSYESGPGHAIFNEIIKDSKKSYELIKYSPSGGEIADEELLQYIVTTDIDKNITSDEAEISDEHGILENSEDASEIPESKVSSSYGLIIWIGILGILVLGGSVGYIVMRKRK